MVFGDNRSSAMEVHSEHRWLRSRRLWSIGSPRFESPPQSFMLLESVTEFGATTSAAGAAGQGCGSFAAAHAAPQPHSSVPHDDPHHDMATKLRLNNAWQWKFVVVAVVCVVVVVIDAVAVVVAVVVVTIGASTYCCSFYCNLYDYNRYYYGPCNYCWCNNYIM
jgi:hypothetical protein